MTPMLQHFGSVRCIVNATEARLYSVPGISKKKAAEIYRVLHAECAAIDTEKNLEDALESQL